LLYADGMDRTLMNYTYSADTPTVPDKELRVFSLRDNKTIRQAMGLFQRQNPDVHVVYDVALTGADAVTASDALRTLANELLAGKGPDLLVLDGMPIDSYVEKGVLLDLSEPVGGKTASGEWLKAEAESFKTADGRIYAVPARFSVPVILADEEAARAKDLTALTDWLVAKGGSQHPRHAGMSILPR
ncbi:MAG: extracellular solute-binding protein, partial [Anaerotruncus massiliensis (ex Togo et al. 2019)]